MKRVLTRGAALLLSVLIVALVLPGDSPVSAATGWTWDSAATPAGSVDVGGGSSGAGVWQAGGMYYVPGVGHMDQPLGAWKADRSGAGVGHVAYTTYDAGAARVGTPDIGLIATGSRPVAARIRVSAGWTDAPVTAVASGSGDLPSGAWVCQSGSSAATQAAGGYRCGRLITACTRERTWCTAYAPSGLMSGGDSGGPVWWYSAGGVRLLGWAQSMRTAPLAADGSAEYLNFVPVWVLQDQVWAGSQSWSGNSGIAPFPAGNQSTGCFVLADGRCVRV